MSPAQFDLQIDRLKSVFGEKAYPNERVKLVWQELKDFSSEWFRKVVDELIGCSKFAPLLPEFREAASKERERLWGLEKRTNAQEARGYMASFGPTHISEITQIVMLRMKGNMDDAQYQGFKDGIFGLSAKPGCEECQDRGLAFREDMQNCTYVYRCYCPLGDEHPQGYPVLPYEKTHNRRAIE